MDLRTRRQSWAKLRLRVAFSETSHTVLASRAIIRNSFRQVGWKVLLGQPVRDKFLTKSGVGSLRGLSTGVALASKWPCYDVVPASVLLEVWQGGRAHVGCIHLGQLPIHVVTLYLVPNAPPGSLKFEINNAVLSWVSKLCPELVGPVLVCGDFNSPLQRWPTVRGLLENGWVIGLLQNEATGEEPQSTCLGTVRHSLHIANYELVRFWRSTYVLSAPDLDKHDVLISGFDVPYTRFHVCPNGFFLEHFWMDLLIKSCWTRCLPKSYRNAPTVFALRSTLEMWLKRWLYGRLTRKMALRRPLVIAMENSST